MEVKQLHSFDLKRTEIARLQTKLAEKIQLLPFAGQLNTIAGCDVSYCRKRDLFFGCMVVSRYPDWKEVEVCFHKTRAIFPYIPGMLSFRELPVLLEMVRKLKTTPDLVLVDGQGIAHPRRLGLASHLGLFIDVPTIGVAKKCLCGKYDKSALKTGKWLPLIYKDEQVGFVIKRKDQYRPLFISPGNKVDQASVQKLMKKIFSFSPYKSPHPLYQAHKYSYDFNQNSR